MPNNIKIIISVLVALVAAAAFYFEHQAGGHSIKWVIAGLGAFMIGALWLFPEAKRKAK